MTAREPRLLEEYLGQQRQTIEAALARYLPAPPDCPSVISEAVRYSVFAGGKRFRPILTLAAAEAVAVVGRRSEDHATDVPLERARAWALPAACAVELIHTYSLIHDDLPAMDNDTLRRGRPTLHVVQGEGIAILAGDGLLTEAFALLARDPPADEDATLASRKLRAIGVIAEAAGMIGMVGGQALDLLTARSSPAGSPAVAAPLGQRPDAPFDTKAEALHTTHAKKTGALIRAAAVAGAVMAGGAERLVRSIERYASELGLAFQIVDDILDVEGATDVLGKTAGKDAAAGKPTYPRLYGLDTSRVLAGASIARARQALADVGLERSWLVEIAAWVGSRTS